MIYYVIVREDTHHSSDEFKYYFMINSIFVDFSCFGKNTQFYFNDDIGKEHAQNALNTCLRYFRYESNYLFYIASVEIHIPSINFNNNEQRIITI